MALLGAAVASFSGCAAIAVAGASQGASYTFTNVAYRTFTFPKGEVRTATLAALQKMQIAIDKEAKRKKDRISAKTADLDIRIELKSVTPKTTKLSVNVKKNMLVKDKAVALEIINQVALALGTR